MQERYVGRSGLRASALGLGTLTWGTSVDVDAAAVQLRRFVDAGGTLVDTGETYGGGAAEEVLGDLLAGVVDRDDVVVVTKAGAGPGSAAGLDRNPLKSPRRDASARSLLAGLDRSLRRLGTDHVDLWLAHGWDPAVPVEETVRALQAAVASGRARYVGVADHGGWQLATAAGVAAGTSSGTAGSASTPLVAVSHELSLLARGAEAHVLPAAAHHGLGALAWAPLGRGVLTGKYRTGVPDGSRADDPDFASWVEPYVGARHSRVAQAVVTAAEGLGVEPAEVALAWVLGVPGVACAVVGARTADQLEVALLGEELELPAEIRAALDDVSTDAA